MYVCDGCKALREELEELKKNTANIRGMFQMLICVCTHKQHAHEDNTGFCDRCECHEFKER